MGYDWEEYENDKADILRGEDPRYEAACEEESKLTKEIYDFGTFLLDVGAHLQVACDNGDCDKMESLLDDVGDWDIPSLISVVREIESVQNYRSEL